MLHMVPSPAGCQIVLIFSRSFLASKGKVKGGASPSTSSPPASSWHLRGAGGVTGRYPPQG